MKNKMLCVIIAILLMFSAAGTVLAADSEDNHGSTGSSSEGVERVPGENGISSQRPSGSSSVQEMFARLQLDLAETAKRQALDKMAQIEALQQEIKQVSDFLNTARECKADAERTGSATEMPSDMAEYMKANNLAYDTTGNDLLMNNVEWMTAIKSLELQLDMLGTETQQRMVSVQDNMEQYNSYLQDANAQISKSSEELARLARGQSMYGDSEVGLAVTGLVVGLVLGCLITLAVQKSRGKKDKA